MSVINRMLTELDRRGAPGPRRQAAADGPPRTEPRRRLLRSMRGMGPPVLLIALVLVAAALWWQQWPRVWALIEGAPERPAAGQPASADHAPAEASLPGVRRFAFERTGATTTLVVAFDRPLEEAPGYGRSGDRLGLQLPARWDRDQLPAPPADQSVYRSAIVAERGEEGTRIALRVDPRARFDLAIEGKRLTLTGRVPAADGGQFGDGDRSASDEVGPAVEAEADTDSEVAGAGRNGPAESGAGDVAASADGAAARQGDASGASGQTGRAEEAAEGASGDMADPAADGAEAAAADSGGNDVDGGNRTPADRDDAEAARAESSPGDGEGRVRKSEPDIAPAERARRLEAKAREALDQGDVTAARGHLVAALEFDPDRHAARDLLVGLALRSGDTEAARNLLAQGLARAPERAAYAKPFARLLVNTGDLERALRVLRRAAPASRDDAGYHGLTAAVAQRLKRHELAASEYTRALEIDSGRGVWWMGLGISLRATGHPGEALAAFREARASGDLNERLDRWVQQRIDALSRTGE